MRLRFSTFLCIVLFLVLLSETSTADDFRAAISSKADLVICDFVGAFRDIATGVAAVVMVIAGVKWTASENDPGARKAAKETMLHAIIGLLLIQLIGILIATASGMTTYMCKSSLGT